jgi:NADP-dependent 3-hydroxy acid dehydrogenase YdfG
MDWMIDVNINGVLYGIPAAPPSMMQQNAAIPSMSVRAHAGCEIETRTTYASIACAGET